MGDRARERRWRGAGALFFSQFLFSLATPSCSKEEDIVLDSQFDPGCSPRLDLTIVGAPLGAGGAENRDEWAEDHFFLSAQWGDVNALGEDAYFSELELDKDSVQDRLDFEELFTSEELTLTFTRQDANGQKTGEEYSVSIYRFARGSQLGGLWTGLDSVEVPVLDGSRMNLARMSGEPGAVANAYRHLIKQALEEDGPVAAIVYCPAAQAVLPCRFRADAVFASDGSIQLSSLVTEKGVFVSDDDSFFSPSYWADAAVSAEFGDGFAVDLLATCTEF